MTFDVSIGPVAERLIKAAHDLKPLIVGMQDVIDRERRLPPALVDRLHELGFFSLWLGRPFGGPELSLGEFASVVEAVAQVNGSVAWCVTNGAACSWLSGFLPVGVARQVFVEQRAVLAGNLGAIGRAEMVPGGYNVTGRWAYGSGIQHSSWTVAGCTIFENDMPCPGADGAFEVRIMLIPTSSVEIIDTWEVSGLCGTGSHDYRVADLFVPASHTMGFNDPSLPGPLYAVPRHTALAVTIAAVPLGIARAALDELRELSAGRTPRIGTTVVRNRPVFQAAFGQAEAKLRAARVFLLQTADDAWSTTVFGKPSTPEQKALVRLACAHAAETAKAVVQFAYEAGGGTSIYKSSPLQRCFQDVHTAAQHVQVQSVNFETGGRVMLGLEPGTPVL